MEMTILDTDYKHFAIVYMCGRHGKTVMTDNFMILGRQKDGEATDPRIAETLEKHGLNLDELISRKNVHCQNNPKFF